MEGQSLMEAEILNISPALIWVVAGSQVLTFALTVWNLLSSGSRANAKKLGDHDDVLANHNGRLMALESGLREMPTQRDFHELELNMQKLTGTMDVLAQRLRPLESITERVQEMLIQQGKS